MSYIQAVEEDQENRRRNEEELFRLRAELLRMTDSAPFDDAWLRNAAGFADDPNIGGLSRGVVWAMRSFDGWRFAYDTGHRYQQVHPQPETRGDVLQLIERVERKVNHG